MLSLLGAQRLGVMEGGNDFSKPKRKKRRVLPNTLPASSSNADGSDSFDDVTIDCGSAESPRYQLLHMEMAQLPANTSEGTSSLNFSSSSLPPTMQQYATQQFPFFGLDMRSRIPALNLRQHASIRSSSVHQRVLEDNATMLQAGSDRGSSLSASDLESVYLSASLSREAGRVLQRHPLSRVGELALLDARNAAHNAYAASQRNLLFPTTTTSAAATQVLARIALQEAIEVGTTSFFAGGAAFSSLSPAEVAGLLREQQIRAFANPISRHHDLLPGMSASNMVEYLNFPNTSRLPTAFGPSEFPTGHARFAQGVALAGARRSIADEMGRLNSTDGDTHSFPPLPPSLTSSYIPAERLPISSSPHFATLPSGLTSSYLPAERRPLSSSPQDLAADQCVPLGIDEDVNWLSELLCFVRSELVEVYRAKNCEVRTRNRSKRVLLGQVGIRCRFCAHYPIGTRASRSSCFPSSLQRIYQSLTMMMRDHFSSCQAIPKDLLLKYTNLKRNTSQGATDSKTYWLDSAKKLGLDDSDDGICVRSATEKTEFADSDNDGTLLGSPPGNASSKNGAFTVNTSAEASTRNRATSPADLSLVPLVQLEDRDSISPLFFLILNQLQLVQMEESERTGNRKSLNAGLPGLGCRHCCQVGRMGLSREFPARRRTLSGKLYDLYDHLLRCKLCPSDVKAELKRLRRLESDQKEQKMSKKERIFFEKLWIRMGHQDE